MSVVSMKQLLEAGVHFGHQTRRWNPKMAEYIYMERNGIYIIDLQKTVKKLEEAYNFVRDVAANGQSILFVGTKKQAAEAVKAAGLAEAAAVAAKGKAEAEAIQAKAEAEAAGILKKAEAMKQYGDAARQQMELDTLKVYFEQLPKIAEAVAKGYTNVESIKMFGGDSSKLAGDIMTTVTQVTDGIKESTGLDINEMLAKGFAKETKSEETGSTANADYHEVKPE